MNRLRLLSITLAASLGVLSPLTAQARSFINIQIITPTPEVQEVVVAPEGYSTCYMVRPRWEGDIWIPAHQECQYQSPQGLSIWATGYWGCNQYWRNGTCRHWLWMPNHWLRRAPDWNSYYRYRHGPHHFHEAPRREYHERPQHGHDVRQEPRQQYHESQQHGHDVRQESRPSSAHDHETVHSHDHQ